jgi:hypothetical protein
MESDGARFEMSDLRFTTLTHYSVLTTSTVQSN